MLQHLRRFTRTRRQQLFGQFLGSPLHTVRILDLGGTFHFWHAWGLKASDPIDVTVVNNHRLDKTHADASPGQANLRRWWGDVMELRAADLAAYDLIFSNSLLEHLPGRLAQQQLARAIMDCGRRYFIQTPNKFSPLDPHFPRLYVPFFATYPRALQARLLSWSALGSGCAAPSYQAALARLQHYHPLSRSVVRELFPSAQIVMERPLGIAMSIIALYPGLPPAASRSV